MSKLLELLGNEADSLMNHRCQTIAREQLHLPGPDFVDRIFLQSDRNPRVLANIQRLINYGRLSTPVISLSCQLTRALNTRPAPVLPRTRTILIPRTS